MINEDTPPAVVSAETLARLFAITVQWVHRLVNENDGVIIKVGRGQYDLFGSITGYVKYLRDRAEGRSVESRDLHAERTRLFSLQADAQDIKNQLSRGEIVPVERVSVALGKVASAIATILESIPIRLKRSNPALTQADLDIVRSEVVKCRNECAGLRP